MIYAIAKWPARVLVAVACLALGPSSGRAALADLSEWAGNRNAEATNDYGVISATSVGGIFQSRKTPAPASGTFVENWYLRDGSLRGGPLGFDDALAMSGTITVSNPNNADPSWFFGWYSSTDYRSRLGISAAQAVQLSNPVNAIRMQVAWGSGGGPTTRPITDNGSNSGSRAVTPAGSYDFSFVYTPGTSNNLTVHIDRNGVNWRRENLPVNLSTPNVFDRFGFLQVGAAPGPNPALDALTFQAIMSDLNYTGQSPLPEPAGALLSTSGLLGLYGFRRRSDAARVRLAG